MTRHTSGRLYHHKTDGGAEYLCAGHVEGSDEGDMRTVVARLDGDGTGGLFPLYAAAPDLLTAAQAAVPWLDSAIENNAFAGCAIPRGGQVAVKALRLAILKATARGE